MLFRSRGAFGVGTYDYLLANSRPFSQTALDSRGSVMMFWPASSFSIRSSARFVLFCTTSSLANLKGIPNPVTTPPVRVALNNRNLTQNSSQSTLRSARYLADEHHGNKSSGTCECLLGLVLPAHPDIAILCRQLVHSMVAYAIFILFSCGGMLWSEKQGCVEWDTLRWTGIATIERDVETFLVPI